MNYRKITSRITGILSLPETYTFYCMALKSDFETMESFVNEETLAELEGLNLRTIQRHISKMKSAHLI